jgi:hypothetical protein
MYASGSAVTETSPVSLIYRPPVPMHIEMQCHARYLTFVPRKLSTTSTE